jgi:hypothetical protein
MINLHFLITYSYKQLYVYQLFAYKQQYVYQLRNSSILLFIN